jgi:hypothetical protein
MPKEFGEWEADDSSLLGRGEGRCCADGEDAARAELGVTQGTVQRVATQLGYGVESVRMWVKRS